MPHNGSLLAEGEVGPHVATTTSGDQIMFGDPLNNVLLPAPGVFHGRIWGHAAGAAITAGLPEAQLPDRDAVFRHVAQSLGGPLEGRPSTGDGHQPLVPVREILAKLWPRTEKVLTADFDEHRRFGPAPQKWWCTIAVFATAHAIVDVKLVLDPKTALIVLMESAIYTSKLMKI